MRAYRSEPTRVAAPSPARAVGACLLLSAAAVGACGGSSVQSSRRAASEGAGEAGVDAGLDAGGDATTDSGAGPTNDSGTPSCVQTLAPGAGASAVIAIDTTTLIQTFTPQRVFGVNSAYWLTPGDVIQTQPKVQAAGGTFIRYPGGSSSDDYHWNGSGAYDESGRWAPSDTSFEPGFPGRETYRGTTSASYGTPANITDGDVTTVWLSNTDTDFPSAQWVYVDLGAAMTVTSVAVDWATPYATTFEVQAWAGSSSYPPPYQGQFAQWQDVSSGVVSGAGGTQTVAFNAVQTRYLRVLMSASSAGAGGAYSIAELRAFSGATPITSNVPSIAQSATTASSTDPASAPLIETNFDFESFMKYVTSFTPAAVPILTVNVGTGTPAEAAAWVHYANVVRGYGIHYWQIGNEMEGDWETGGPLNAQDYVRRFAAYHDAMKAVDPTIAVLGPVSGGIDEPSNLDDAATFIQDFITILHARALDADVDGIDFHWYPNYNTVAWAPALATTSALGAFATNLHGWIAQTSVSPGVPVFMTEYNEALGSPNTPVSCNQLLGGLWVASALGEFITSFGAGGGTNLWNTISGGPTPDSNNAMAGDLGYLQYNQNAYRFQERAQYWALQMLASDWAIAGDPRDHRLVSCTSSQPLLAAYADERPDGLLSLLVINKSAAASYSATIQGVGAPAGALPDVWTFDSSRYAWETTAVPYHAEPDEAPSHAVYCGATAGAPLTFGPGSITVIRFGGSSDAGGAGPVDAAGPVGDAGPATVVIDDMSDTSGAQIRLPPTHAGAFAGSWYTYIGGGGGPDDLGQITPASASEVTDGASSAFAYTAIGPGAPSGIASPPGQPDQTQAACASGVTPAAPYAYAAEGFSFETIVTDAGYVAPYVDISAYSGIQFWIYNGLTTFSAIRFQIPDKESNPQGGICGQATDGSAFDACYNAVYVELTVDPGWSFQQVPYAALAASPYYGYPQPAGGDMTTATDVHFEIDQSSATAQPVPFDFCVADVAFYR